MSRIKEALIVTGALAFTAASGVACGNSSETPSITPEVTGSTQTYHPNPSETATPLATQEQLAPFTQIPNVPDEFRVSTKAIYDYLITQRLAGNRLRLVDNDVYDLDVFRTGTGETEITYGLTAKIKNPKSAQRAIEVRNQVCADLFEAAGSVAAELSIQFGVAVPNAGANPMDEIGFTPEKAQQDFTQVTTCGDIAA